MLRSRLFSTPGACLTALLICTFTPQAAAEEITPDTLSARLKNLAQELNEPERIDDQTVLQTVTANGKSLRFSYTVNAVEGVDPRLLEQSAHNVLCTEADLAAEIDAGAIIEIRYDDKEEKPFASIDVTRQSCGR